jgi:hypothetical protein
MTPESGHYPSYGLFLGDKLNYLVADEIIREKIAISRACTEIKYL